MDEFDYVAVALRLAKQALSVTGPPELMALWEEDPFSYEEMVKGIQARIVSDLVSLKFDISSLEATLEAKKERARRCEEALRELAGSGIEAWYEETLRSW